MQRDWKAIQRVLTPSAALRHTASFPQRTTRQTNISMDLHHPILREFPEHREVIKRLKGSDDHFRKMFDEYHRLDDSVYRIEEEIDFATDHGTDAPRIPAPQPTTSLYHLAHPPTTSPPPPA